MHSTHSHERSISPSAPSLLVHGAGPTIPATVNRWPGLLAIYAWSHFSAKGSGYDGAGRDAVGLLLRSNAVITRRAQLDTAQLLDWWLHECADEPSDLPSNLQTRLIRYFDSLAHLPPGATARDVFGTVMRLAGASGVAPLLWDALAGRERTTVRARTSLLVLLYDLGDVEALSALFEYAGENRKYLNALVVLAERATVEPSAKLLTAIRQNLRTLDDRVKERPFRDFARQVAARLQLDHATLTVDVSGMPERHTRTGDYRLLLTVKPDEADPPLTLTLALVAAGDFAAAPNHPAELILTKEQPLLACFIHERAHPRSQRVPNGS